MRKPCATGYRARNVYGVFVFSSLLALASCGGDNTPSPPSAAVPTTYTIGVTVSGLHSGASVTLLDNGADSLRVSADGAATFATALAGGSTYAITVAAQPTGETCTVAGGSGSVDGSNVTGIKVSCIGAAFTIGGTISGLASGASLTLQDNGADNLAASANGAFTFATSLVTGAHYAVTIVGQPNSQTCSASDSSGTVGTANITSVEIACTTKTVSPATYTIGGTVSGLAGGTPVMLLDNGADDLTISANGMFAFKTPLASGTTYTVSIGTEPAGATCGVTNGNGTVGSTNVTNVAVSCSLNGGSTTPNETVLYNFGPSSSADGGDPIVLLQGEDGNFVGITFSGGTNGTGTAFRLTLAGVETVLYSFGPSNSADGSEPNTLIQGSEGNFYGTTEQGDTNEAGTVFKLTPAGIEAALYGFGTSGRTDGLLPLDFIQGADGNFYGVTAQGGTNSLGTFFKATPTGVETVIYNFGASAADSSIPEGLIQGADGNFYGFTPAGGANGDGSIFKITPAGTETVLYSFGGSSTDGITPAALIQGSDGNFYGSASYGGANGTGSVFKITPNGVETVLYNFAAASISGGDSGVPNALIQGKDGNFYGTGRGGGTGNKGGSVFRITPDGVETVLYSFGTGGSSNEGDGSNPHELIQGADGNLYGTTEAGGTNGTGVVFKVTP